MVFTPMVFTTVLISLIYIIMDTHKYNIQNTNAHFRKTFVQLRNAILRKDKQPIY